MFNRVLGAVVVAVALVVPSVALAGNVIGHQARVATVAPLGSDTYSVTLRGGELASIDVRGDGDTDLDCYLTDENGNVVARDVDKSDTCVLVMTPKWTGNFKVEVRNNGTVFNRYRIGTN